MKVQLGSTYSKGLPVLFQGSHQGLFLNKNHYLLAKAGPWPFRARTSQARTSHQLQFQSKAKQGRCCLVSKILLLLPSIGLLLRRNTPTNGPNLLVDW